MKIYFVDSFTSEKFKGNPAAVCFPESTLEEDTMQKIAAEIGFSETAFIEHISDDTFSIRFFTPKIEIQLCGHATLASAKIIFDTTTLDSLKFINYNKVELSVEKVGNKIKMQFPIYEVEEIEVPNQLLVALGISEIVNKKYIPVLKIILLEIDSANELTNLSPDFPALVNSYQGINGVLVTAISDRESFDFHYRYFWPWAGTNEDPVTGGVHTFLTTYWGTKLNKTKLNAFQSSLRTGTMSTELFQDKVFILGEAVTVLEGKFIF
jgi:PhzF family phenazine biosynthesis protein